MAKSVLKLLYVCELDPNNIREWSGTLVFMREALKTEFEDVTTIKTPDKPFFLLVLEQLPTLFNRFVLRKDYPGYRNSMMCLYNALRLRRIVKKGGYDAVFAPISLSAWVLAPPPVPVIHFSDSSFSQYNALQPRRVPYAGWNERALHRQEEEGARRSAALVYATRWAADFARQYNGASPEKITLLPFGPNFPEPGSEPEIRSIKEVEPVRFLWLAVDWERKGGSLVLETMRTLRSRGVRVHLTVCGFVPPEDDPDMTVIPFLNKSVEADRKQLSTLLTNAHFLFVPTRADCFGIVFVEAASYGLPVITSHTGGVPEVVLHNETGVVLPLSAGPGAYADAIMELIQDPDAYSAMQIAARKRQQKQFTWAQWARGMRAVIETAVDKHRTELVQKARE